MKLINISFQFNGSSLQAISHYNIAMKVPLEDRISYQDLAEKCGMDTPSLKQIMIIRFAIVFHRLFREPQKGFIAHSAGSRAIVEDSAVQAGIGQFDLFYRSSARVCYYTIFDRKHIL